MENIVGKIKKYLERLDKGERLEAVRADFVRELGGVDASEIMAQRKNCLKRERRLTRCRDFVMCMQHCLREKYPKKNG